MKGVNVEVETPISTEDIISIAYRWQNGLYVPFTDRRRLLRAAVTGAFVEKMIVNGSTLAAELNQLRAAAINDLEAQGNK